MMNVMHELVLIIAKYLVVVPVAAIIFVFVRLGKKDRIELLIFLAISVIFTAVLAKLASALHQDPRPFVRDGVKPYFPHGSDNGFPSDHTTYSALLAFVVLRYSRWLGIALAVTSLLIGTARVIAGVHHAQDIVAGFLIAAVGVGMGALLLRFAKFRSQTPTS